MHNTHTRIGDYHPEFYLITNSPKSIQKPSYMLLSPHLSNGNNINYFKHRTLTRTLSDSSIPIRSIKDIIVISNTIFRKK